MKSLRRESVAVDRTTGGFERAIMPHLDAAYNLARWLTRHEHDAQDIVQEAYLRAFKALDQFHGAGGDARCWLLAIVRNTCFTWLHRNRAQSSAVSFEADAHEPGTQESDPQMLLEQNEDSAMLRRAIEELPVEFREVLVYREFEGLSYQEIAAIAGVPVGTVMSRLARARDRLHKSLCARMIEEP
jgi:RNA polymerase sigma factor (sigma-70 family)